MISDFPYRDLDGTPWPDCDHQHMTTDPAELAVVRGVMLAIVDAGVPEPFVRAGEAIKTTWGCERNKKKVFREAVVTCVNVGLYRGRQSMWYRPACNYIAKDGATYGGMYLQQIERQDGRIWEMPRGGSWNPIAFRLEWVSPITGRIERAEATP